MSKASKKFDIIAKLDNVTKAFGEVVAVSDASFSVEKGKITGFLYNRITEIKGLETLTKLRKLNLNNNDIEEIRGLDTLKKLKELNLSGNRIREIKGLDTLINN